MRSVQVYRALDQVSNRFTLCQTISQSVRLLHKSGDSLESSVTSALIGVGDRMFHGQVTGEPVIPMPTFEATTLFHQ